MNKKTLLLISTTLLFCFSATTANDIPLVYDAENTGADCSEPALPPASQCKSVTGLPDPFEWSDGSGRIESFADWTCRRNEIKREIEHYEIGEKPKFDKLEASFSGGTLTVKITDGGRSLTLTSKVVMPNGSGPHPVVIGMDGNTGSMGSNYFSKCIQIPFSHTQIAEYNSGFGGAGKSRNDPFFKLYPNDFHKGDYCAWSWGISRLIDGLEICKEQMKADMTKIAVTGCSYAGKMALYAGAFDERIALTIAQESGGGGINSWRVSEKIGSSVEGISNTNYDWFMQSFKTNFNGQTSKIPYDHHELVAMIAPRAFLAFGNKGYEWLGDESGYISLQAAFEVWKAMGIEDRFGYVFDSGHNHCQASAAQNNAADKFIKKFLYGDDTQDTNIRTSIINTDYTSWKNKWHNHTLSVETADLTAKISVPSAGAKIFSDLGVTIKATVKAKNGVKKAVLYLNNEIVSESISDNYSFTINDPEVGEYSTYIVITDNNGEEYTSDEVNFSVIERKTFKMQKNTLLTIEAEEMPERDGQYIGEYDEQFSGMAYYANKDQTSAQVFLNPAEGDYIVSVKGCADASTTASLSMYINNKKAETFSWKNNIPSEITKEISFSGGNPYTLTLVMETDNGQSDAFVDYITFAQKGADLTSAKIINDNSIVVSTTEKQILINGDFISAELIDYSGISVLKTTDKTINISNLEKGIYIIKIKTDKDVLVSKIAKI